LRAYRIEERLPINELMIRAPRHFGRFYMQIRANRKTSSESDAKAL
jgi:hypothetical protein